MKTGKSLRLLVGPFVTMSLSLALTPGPVRAQEAAEESPPPEMQGGTSGQDDAASTAPGGTDPATPTTEQPGTEREADETASESKDSAPAPTVLVTDIEGGGTDDEATQLDTIAVTADKRVKAQRDIPGSVGAIRGADLEKIQAQGLKDYLKLVPGVVFADQGNEESVPIIRGIATSIGFGSTPATVGVYMDEMPFADLFQPSSFPDLNPFDLERVEILKGPQGTLFGSGALAGAIRYIVQKPNHGVWEGKLMGTLSQTEFSDGQAQVVAGAINAPLFGDAVAFRAVGLYRTNPGTYDMSASDSAGNSLRDEKDADKLEQVSARVLASWDVTEILKVSGFYFDQTTHSDDVSFADQTTSPENRIVPFASPRDHDFGGGNLSVTYDFDWAHLLSSTNQMTKRSYVVNHIEHFASPNQNQIEGVRVGGDDINGYTQEFRLSSPEGGDSRNWDWLLGASYLNYANEGWGYYYIGPDRPDPTSLDQVSEQDKATSQLISVSDQVASEAALFGEITGRLGDYWEVTLGARRYETKLEADTLLCGLQIAALTGQTCLPQQLTETAEGLNPKFSIRYLHDRNIQTYVLAAKGFQFGGVQIDPPNAVFELGSQQSGYQFAPYKSSKLWNYEMGLRTEWLDRRLRWDFTLFYQDWKDLQITVIVPDPATGAGLFGVIANVGRAHSEGLETVLEMIPFSGAKYTTSAAWVSAVTDELFDEDADDGGVKPGTRLPGSPRFQWSNVLSYEKAVPYFTSWNLGSSLTHTHLGSSPSAIRPEGEIGGYDTLDARLFLTNPTWRFAPELSLGMNNITDVRGLTFYTAGQEVEPFEFAHFVQPRTTVLSLSLRY